MDPVAQFLPYAPIALQFLTGEGYGDLKTELRTWAKRDPIDALLAAVLGGGLAFYLAEKDTNPKCKTPWDGVLYIATSLSVGYDNLFPTTPAGHALATFIQTFGPSLAANALEPPAADRALAAPVTTTVSPDVNLAILERLDRIVQLLEAKP